jgi:hypothetical protein
VDRSSAALVRPGHKPRHRLTRGLAFLVLALTAFPFTAPCPVCDIAAVVGHAGPGRTLPVRLNMAPPLRMAPALSRTGESPIIGEEPGDHDVLPVDPAADASPRATARLESHILRPTQPRAAAFLRAAPLRL